MDSEAPRLPRKPSIGAGELCNPFGDDKVSRAIGIHGHDGQSGGLAPVGRSPSNTFHARLQGKAGVEADASVEADVSSRILSVITHAEAEQPRQHIDPVLKFRRCRFSHFTNKIHLYFLNIITNCIFTAILHRA